MSADLTPLSTEELHEGYRSYSAEINRRRELQRIPQEIGNLAQQGRDIGMDEAVLVEAITRAPEENPTGEEF